VVLGWFRYAWHRGWAGWHADRYAHHLHAARTHQLRMDGVALIIMMPVVCTGCWSVASWCEDEDAFVCPEWGEAHGYGG
jgi:hypothetical protein